MRVSQAELQLAYQDTQLYRVTQWPLERAMQVPGVVRILERLAAHRQQRMADANSRPIQMRLV
jgi:hypothetical protein